MAAALHARPDERGSYRPTGDGRREVPDRHPGHGRRTHGGDGPPSITAIGSPVVASLRITTALMAGMASALLVSKPATHFIPTRSAAPPGSAPEASRASRARTTRPEWGDRLNDGGSRRDRRCISSHRLNDGGSRRDRRCISSHRLNDGGSRRDRRCISSHRLNDGGSRRDRRCISSHRLNDGGSRRDRRCISSHRLNDGGSRRDRRCISSHRLNDGGSRRDRRCISSHRLNDGGSRRDRRCISSHRLNDGGSRRDRRCISSHRLNDGGSRRDRQCLFGNCCCLEVVVSEHLWIEWPQSTALKSIDGLFGCSRSQICSAKYACHVVE